MFLTCREALEGLGRHNNDCPSRLVCRTEIRVRSRPIDWRICSAGLVLMNGLGSVSTVEVVALQLDCATEQNEKELPVTESSRADQIRRSLEQHQAAGGPKETLTVPLQRRPGVLPVITLPLSVPVLNAKSLRIAPNWSTTRRPTSSGVTVRARRPAPGGRAGAFGTPSRRRPEGLVEGWARPAGSGGHEPRAEQVNGPRTFAKGRGPTRAGPERCERRPQLLPAASRR